MLEVGDYVYVGTNTKNATIIGQVEKVEGNKVWAFWSVDDVSILPKTIKQFNDIPKSEALELIEWDHLIKFSLNGSIYAEIGQYIFFRKSNKLIKIGKIEKIEYDLLFCHWAIDDIREKPMTLKELESIPTNEKLGGMNLSDVSFVEIINSEEDIKLSIKEAIKKQLLNINNYDSSKLVIRGELSIENIIDYIFEDVIPQAVDMAINIIDGQPFKKV